MSYGALPWANAPYSIKRHGVSITNCDSEPVQTPGCIQAHGGLLVLRESDFTILQAAENCSAIFGVSATELLGKPVSAIVGDANVDDLARFIRDEPIENNPLYVFTLTTNHASLDATVHRTDGALVLELEATGRTDSAIPDYYSAVRAAVSRLQHAKGLRDFSEVVAWETRLLTGFDRVMIYRFHDDGHGEVFAEARRADLEPWLGLHYPAEDIPLPAREVFRRTWVRPVPNVTGELAELVPLVNPENQRPLLMTHCALRGPSVMYTEYLQNMGVSAACTMALRQGDHLWGLVACHHYTGVKPMPYELRAACELVAQVASLQLQSADAREHTAYRLSVEETHREVVRQYAKEDDQMTAFAAARGIDAGGFALLRGGVWSTVGDVPAQNHRDELAGWVQEQPAAKQDGVFATHALSSLLPSAKAYSTVASGVVIAVIGRDLMMWFRPEMIHTVNWAGDPHAKPTVLGPHGPRLTPRGSFALFSEQVSKKSAPWLHVEVEAVARMRSSLLEVVVRRSQEVARLNEQLTRTNDALDAFAYVASHDLKEPLRGIHKYAHQLANESLLGTGPDERAKLESLMRLAVRMDSLLESLLRFSRVDRAQLAFDTVSLDEVLAEAIEMVSSRTDSASEVIVKPRPLPSVPCDRMRVRDIFVNLLSNALKYNDKPQPRIEVGYQDGDGPRAFYVRDNGIGIAERHRDEVFKMFRRLHGRDAYGGGTGAGLTIVKKIVERHGGLVWLTSKEGEGTTFWFTLSGEGP